jgi:hypothetical protein
MVENNYIRRMRMSSRTCRQCGLSKVANEENFYVTKVIKGQKYFRGVCKSCYSPTAGKNAIVGKGTRPHAVEAVKSEDHVYDTETFAQALIDLCRHSMERLNLMSKKEFETKTKARKFLVKSGVEWDAVKAEAREKLTDMGFSHPATMELGEGTYLIVGDSHGKWTKRPMFELLRNLNRHIKLDKIIHVGHMVDDDNDVSYLWEDFDNLLVLAKPEELQTVHARGYDIVRDTIGLGDISVVNQELVTDYVRNSIRTIDGNLFAGKTICNLHRLERHSRCTSEPMDYIASPGCLCEPHIVKTIKQIDFNDGYQTKIVYPDTFIKYRRAKQLSRVWNQGITLVRVEANGQTHILQSSIHTVGTEKCTAVFDKIYAGGRVVQPDDKIFVVADTHSPDMDFHVLDVQRQIAEKFKADALVDLGDVINFSCINHHAIGRGEIKDYADKSLMKEASIAHWLLKERAGWSDFSARYLLFANHERFSIDFVKRNPQFSEILDIETLLSTEKAGYTVVAHKEPLRIGPFVFVHGDMTLFGESGCVFDKFSKAFAIKENEALLFGHGHSAGIRSSAYRVGMSGLLTQGYNETSASYWTQGASLATSYKNKAFVQLLDIMDGRCWYGDKILSGLSPKVTLPRTGSFNINYTYEGGN